MSSPFLSILFSLSFFSKNNSSSKLGDAPDGAPNDFNNPSPSLLPSDKEEYNEKDSFDSVDPLPPKDSSSPSSIKEVHKPLPFFLHML